MELFCWVDIMDTLKKLSMPFNAFDQSVRKRDQHQYVSQLVNLDSLDLQVGLVELNTNTM